VRQISGVGVIGVVLAALVAAGCSGGQSDLQKWIEATKKKPGGRIQPLPEVKPYETYVYSVGTFKVGNNFYGLVQSKDGLVHKVQPGNYMGQNDGKVTEITGGRISLVEIIPDGLGGYIERPASLALAN